MLASWGIVAIAQPCGTYHVGQGKRNSFLNLFCETEIRVLVGITEILQHLWKNLHM
jgi:hypothetical protein